MIIFDSAPNVSFGIIGMEFGHSPFYISKNGNNELQNILQPQSPLSLPFNGEQISFEQGFLEKDLNPLQYPLYVYKDLSVVAFYSFQSINIDNFDIQGRAPAGRVVYLSTGEEIDFSEHKITSTVSDNKGRFIFSNLSFEDSTDLIVWVTMKETDSLTSFQDIFNCNIILKGFSTNIISFNNTIYMHEKKKTATITVTSNWVPTEHFNNQLYIYCLKDREFLLQTSRTFSLGQKKEDYINNIFCAKNIQGERELSSEEREILNNSFNGLSQEAQRIGRLESIEYVEEKGDFYGVLAWSVFYDDIIVENLELNIEVVLNTGYMGYAIELNEDGYNGNNECSIEVKFQNENLDDLDYEVFFLHTNQELNENEELQSLVDLSGEALKIAFVKNLLIISSKQDFNKSDEAIIKETMLKSDSTELANLVTSLKPQVFESFMISSVTVKETFNKCLAWIVFYNNLPAEPLEIALALSEPVPDDSNNKNLVANMTKFFISFSNVYPPTGIKSVNCTFNSTGGQKNYRSILFPGSFSVEGTNLVTDIKTIEDCKKNLYLLKNSNGLLPKNEAEANIIKNTFQAAINYTDSFFDTLPSTMIQDDRVGSFYLFFFTFTTVENAEQITVANSINIGYVNQNVCLSGDTLITMADGSKKRLDNLTENDEVLDKEFKPTKILKIKIQPSNSSYYINHFENNIVIKEAAPHRFFNIEQGFYQKLKKWKIGDHALHENGSKVALLKRELVKGEEVKYGLYTESGTYFANGLLSGIMEANKKEFQDSNIEKIVNMVTSIDPQRSLGFVETGEY